MKFIAPLSITFLFVSAPAFADENAHPFRAGFGADIGVPSGASLGLVVHPKEDFLTLQASFSYALSPGGRLSLKIDPIALTNFPLAIFGDVQGGFFVPGHIPGHSELPSLAYQYVNTYLGIRLGRPNGFAWVIEGGPTYLNAQLNGNLSSFVNTKGLTYEMPKVSGWVMPTFLTGFSVVW